MRIDARDGGYLWKAFDLDAGREIPLCVWADDETDEYEAYKPGPNGQPYFDPTTNDAARFRGHCRLVLIPPGGSLPVIVGGADNKEQNTHGR